MELQVKLWRLATLHQDLAISSLACVLIIIFVKFCVRKHGKSLQHDKAVK